MHSKVISIPSTKFEPPPVHKMMTNNRKDCQKKKHKVNKLIETDTKLDLWAFVKVTRANEANNAFTVLSKADTEVDALVSASFGFVLRSPIGGETKLAGEPAPLKIETKIIKIGGTKLLVITERKY